MIERLTDEDKSILKDLNFLRFDKYTYAGLFIAGVIWLIISPILPFSGWKIKPETPPKDFEEYISRLIPYLLIVLPIFVLQFINWGIKKYELIKGTKKIEIGRVVLKKNLIFKRKLILFSPFLPIIYRRPYHFMDLKPNEKVKMEISASARLINYFKI